MAVKSKSIRKKAVAKSACMRRSRAKKRAYRAAQYLLQRRAQSRGFVKENDQITIPGTKEKTTLKPYNYQPVKLPVSKDPFEENCFEKQRLPEGYVFVLKGDVYITRHCRSKTKESERIVYVVYHNSGKRTLGLRVPSDIYTAVLASAAETAESRANAVKLRDEKDQSRARELLRDQFPLIPAQSLEAILDHAFLKGSGRVGRTSTKSEGRKALLAVEAHIRHVHTPYEDLLRKGMRRDKARRVVWDKVQAIKNTWEGAESHQKTMGLGIRGLEFESESSLGDDTTDSDML